LSEMSAQQNTVNASSLPLDWRIRVPACGQGSRVRRFFIYAGAPGLLILAVLWALARTPPFLYFTLIMTAFILILFALVFAALRKGAFEWEYTLDHEGIHAAFLPLEDMTWADRLALVFFLPDGLTGDLRLSWNEIESASAGPSPGLILIRTEETLLPLYCPDEDRGEILMTIGELLSLRGI